MSKCKRGLSLLVVVVIAGACARSIARGQPVSPAPEKQAAAETPDKVAAYLDGLRGDKSAARLVDVVRPEALARLAKKLRQTAKDRKVDGEDADWKEVPVGARNAKGSVVVFASGKPAAPAPEGMDLAEVSCLYTDTDLFIRFKTHVKPETKEVRYDLHLYQRSGAPAYMIVLSSEGSTLWDRRGAADKFIPLTSGVSEMRIGEIVEARIARALLPGLEESFEAMGVSFSAKLNRACFAPRFKVRSLATMPKTTSLYLLARYAEKIDLAKGDLLPLATCITESWIFDYAEAGLRERIIQDGLATIAAGRALASRLGKLPPEALLAWTNRSFTWGSNMGVYLLDDKQRITAEAYEFMILDPRLLVEVRDHLDKAGLTKHRSVKGPLAGAVDEWFGSKNRYRFKVESLEIWANTLGDRPRWQKILRETKADVQAGRDKICTVNGKAIEFYWVNSANVNWRHYRKHGFYYGCCGDTAIMTMLGYRALGIPDTCFAWRFGVEDSLVHTFAGYFDSGEGKWKSRQAPPKEWAAKKGSVLTWSLPPVTDTISPLVRVPLPAGVDMWTNKRCSYLLLGGKDMRAKLLAGFPHAEYCQRLYAQLDDAGVSGSEPKGK